MTLHAELESICSLLKHGDPELLDLDSLRGRLRAIQDAVAVVDALQTPQSVHAEVVDQWDDGTTYRVTLTFVVDDLSETLRLLFDVE